MLSTSPVAAAAASSSASSVSTMSSPNGRSTRNAVGIHAVEIYFPKKFVDQTELETFDGVSSGKYTIGLGQSKMAVCDDREDIHSICLSAVTSLMEKYNISPLDIGRLEVGTETIVDKSKSVKSVLMQLFEGCGNTSIEGIDTTNACYGGTSALFNAIHWIESSYWDGRYALVVAADIAVYKTGAARPTGGAGAVAMLLGVDAPLVFDAGLRGTHMGHAYDFYKPDLHSEYPEVDGPLSNMCYIKAVDMCYNRYLDRIQAQGPSSGSKETFVSADSSSTLVTEVEAEEATPSPSPNMDSVDYFAFHSPYTKLVQKSFARLAFNDFLRGGSALTSGPEAVDLAPYKSMDSDLTITDRALEKTFMALTKEAFGKKVGPGLLVAKNIGNMYCASVFGGLASILSEVPSAVLQGKRIGMFSYGSGFASSMYSLTVRGDTSAIAAALSIAPRLATRTPIAPAAFDTIMALREATHNVKDYTPVSPTTEDNLFGGAYFLERVDDKYRRSYGRASV